MYCDKHSIKMTSHTLPGLLEKQLPMTHCEAPLKVSRGSDLSREHFFFIATRQRCARARGAGAFPRARAHKGLLLNPPTHHQTQVRTPCRSRVFFI